MCVPINIDITQLQLILGSSKFRMTDPPKLVSTNIDIGQLQLMCGSSRFGMTNLAKLVL